MKSSECDLCRKQRHVDHDAILSVQEYSNHQAAIIVKMKKALKWYAEWDWTDKYIQPIPKRAKECLNEITFS